MANLIINELSNPFLIRDETLFLSLSIGISLYPNDATDSKELQKHADRSMYRAKERGRNMFQFYKSLSVLKDLNIDFIKIDKAFINDVVFNAGAASIVKTMIDMSLNLGIDVVAEGIENNQQAIFLKSEQCKIGQGYLFSKPLPKDQVLEMLTL